MTVGLIARQVKVVENSATRFQTHCPAVQLCRYTRGRRCSSRRGTKKSPWLSPTRARPFLRHLPGSLAMWLLTYPCPPVPSAESRRLTGVVRSSNSTHTMQKTISSFLTCNNVRKGSPLFPAEKRIRRRENRRDMLLFSEV